MNVLVSRDSGLVILEGVAVRSTFFERLTGYALKRAPGDPGLLFPQTRRVHTWGMLFPLDLYFFDDSFCLLGSSLAVPSIRFPPSPVGTRHILEVPHLELAPPLPLAVGEEVTLLWGSI